MTPLHRREPPPEFAQLKAECDALGYLIGVDYVIPFYPYAASSDEWRLEIEDDGDYSVVYRERGSRRVELRTPDFAEARELFLENVSWAAGADGRGPNAGKRRPPPWGDRELTDEELYIECLRLHGSAEDKASLPPLHPDDPRAKKAAARTQDT